MAGSLSGGSNGSEPTPSQHSNQRTKPSKDHQGADKDRHPTPQDDDIHEQGEYKDQHVPLRDPSEGRNPAVIGQDVGAWNGDFQDQGYAQEHVTVGVRGEPIEDGERDPDTIAEEQRRRSEDMQAEGVQTWMAQRDSRSEQELANSQFVADEPRGQVVATGGGPPLNPGFRGGPPPLGSFAGGPPRLKIGSRLWDRERRVRATAMSVYAPGDTPPVDPNADPGMWARLMGYVGGLSPIGSAQADTMAQGPNPAANPSPVDPRLAGGGPPVPQALIAAAGYESR